MAASTYFAQIQNLYIAYFGRPADPTGLNFWATKVDAANGNVDAVIAGFSASTESAALFGNKSSVDKVIAIYQNAFGRAPEPAGLAFWVQKLDSGEVTQAQASYTIQQNAGAGDKDAVANKLAAAQAFTAQLDTTAEIQGYQGDASAASARAFLAAVTQDPATATAAVAGAAAAVAASATGIVGSTFMLTKGLDNYQGTSGNDTILGSIDGTNTELQTLSSLDVINGGAGVDTLKVSHNSTATNKAAISLGNLSNVEIVQIDSTSTQANDADVNTSTIAGVTNLNYIRSAADFKATAANTTDVSISGATAGIAVDGGKNITVSDATLDKAITIGATTKGAVGTITVTDTKVGTGAIAINGGTDVTVNLTGSTATGDLKIGQGAAAADKPTGAVKVTSVTAADVNANTTQHAVTITGGSTVEVTQTASSTKAGSNAEAWTAPTITQGAVSVTGANGTTSVTVNQTKSTAAVNAVKAVAAVTESASVKFGALKSGQSIIIGGNGDGTLAAGELQFTAAKDLTAEEVAQAFANLTNPDLQAGGKVANGTYSTNGNFTTWTSGAASGDTVVFSSTATGPQADFAAKAAGAGTLVEPVVTPTNGVSAVTAVTGVLGVITGAVTIDDNATAASAAITTVTLDGYGTTGIGANNNLTKLATLNLANSGGATAGATNAAVTTYVGAALASLNLGLNNVQGAVTLTGAGLKTVNVTTSGANSATELSAAAAETLTIAGDKSVNLSTGTFTALKSITVSGSAGATFDGDEADTLTSVNTSATTGTVTATIEGARATYTGGAGVDIVTLLTDTALTKAIDLGAGDDTLYFDAAVVSTTATLSGGEGVDTLKMKTDAAATLSGTSQTFYTGFERLTLADAGTGDKAVNLANLGLVNYVTTTGSGGTLTLNNLANNGTVVLTTAPTTGYTINIKDAATGTADVLNVVAQVVSADIDFKTITATKVETINLTATDTKLDDDSNGTNDPVELVTAVLTADKATTVNLGASNANLNLTLTGSTAVTLVDGSTMTGNLTLIANGATAGTEVRGGSGNDVLTAFGENDVLKGNGGNDTFNLTDLTSAYGGAGADVFNFAVNSNLTKVSKVYEVGAGDVFKLLDLGTAAKLVNAAGVAVDKFYAAGAQYNPDTTTDVAGKVNAALVQTGEGEATWFNHGGNTFIVIDADDGSNLAAGAVDTYQAGQDIVIQIVGEFNLGTGAAFNTVTGTLEIL